MNRTECLRTNRIFAAPRVPLDPLPYQFFHAELLDRRLTGRRPLHFLDEGFLGLRRLVDVYDGVEEGRPGLVPVEEVWVFVERVEGGCAAHPLRFVGVSFHWNLERDL